MINIKKFIVIFLFSLTGFTHQISSISPDLLRWLEGAKGPVQTKTFFNGLTTIVARIPNTGRVHIRVTYPCGAKDELAEHEYGLAHLVEHMIFKGTKRLSEGDIKAICQKFCSRGSNAFTGTDTTTYFFDTDAANWPVFLDVLIDCMYNCTFDADALASEVKAVVTELTMRSDTPFQKTYDAAASILFPLCHPYHHPLGGNQESVCRATSHDLKHFYRKHYHPNKAVLTIVGDIDHEVTLQEVETALKKFDTDSHYKVHDKKTSQDTLPLPEQFVHSSTTYFQHIQRPTATLMWLFPANHHLPSDSIDCLAFIVEKRLRKKLIDDHSLVYTDGLSISVIPQSLATLFFISFSPTNCFDNDVISFSQTTKAIAVCKEHIDAILSDIMHQGPTAGELDMFKQTDLTNFLNGIEQETFIASALTSSYLDFGGATLFFDRMLTNQAMSIDDIKDLCTSSMQPHTKHEIIIMPVAKEQEAAWLSYQAQRDAHQKSLLGSIKRESLMGEPSFVHQLDKPKLLEPRNVYQPDAEFVISNGLRVLFKKRTTTPMVTIHCVFRNGELFNLQNDLSTKSYVRNLALSLAPEESDAGTKEEVSDCFLAHGATYSFSRNGASMNCISSEMQHLLPIFFSVLTSPRYPEKSLAQELKTMLDGLQQVYQQANYRGQQFLLETLFADYPWKRSHEQTYADVQSITRNDVVAFHNTYIRPSLMTVVVVGNTDAQTVRQILEQATAHWHDRDDTDASACLYAAPIPTLPSSSFTGYTKLVLPEDQMVTLVAGRLLPEREHPDELPLRLLEAYVNKKLYEIREATGIFYGINICLTSGTFHVKDMGCLWTQVAPHNLAAAKQTIESVLQKIHINGIPADDLTTAQQTYSMHLAQMFTSNGALAGYFSWIDQEQQGRDYVQQRLAAVKAVTKADVDAVAKIYLDPTSWLFVAAGRIPHEPSA